MDKQRRRLLRLGLLGGGSLLGWRVLAQAGKLAEAADPDIYRRMVDKIRDLFEKKHPPGAFDWLASHDEKGQSFAQYLKSNPNRPTAQRTRLYLQPIGGFDAAQEPVLVKLLRFMQLIFGVEVRRLATLDLAKIPASAQRVNRNSRQVQILTTHVLEQVLQPNRPADAVAMLALTPSDLWPGAGWNFVFGQASLEQRVGVWSTARLGDPVKDAGVFLRRVLQVAIHETGHMFGIEHCIAYQCCMNGSNSLDESDRTPLAYCPECDAKLGWACKLEPAKRARELTKFAAENQLAKEAELWGKIAARL